jgi:IS30 family transposase
MAVRAGPIHQYCCPATDLTAVSYRRVARVGQKLDNHPRKYPHYFTRAQALGPVLRFSNAKSPAKKRENQ